MRLQRERLPAADYRRCTRTEPARPPVVAIGFMRYHIVCAVADRSARGLPRCRADQWFGGSMEQLSSLDAALVYLESKALSMHMGAVFVYDPSSAPGGNVAYPWMVRPSRAANENGSIGASS